MSRTASVNARIEPEIKLEAEKLLSDLGLSISDAINIFMKKLVNYGGIPFEIKKEKYNRKTLLALEEAKKIRSGEIQVKSYSSFKEFLEGEKI